MAFYSVKHKEKEIQKISSSGGAFTALSEVILSMGGVIAGAKYNYSTHEMEHVICRTAKERDALRGSKYIQSNVNDIYQKIREESRDRKVLFVGTPCQVAGLKSYMEMDKKVIKDNVYLCDLICHGVPSPDVWKTCISGWKTSIKQITFKDKSIGWRQPLAFAFLNNEKKKSLRKYTLLYFGDLISRPSCTRCPYSSFERTSDLTIGDHWSVDKEFYDRDGVSLVITNTEKGNELFRNASKDLIWVECKKEECGQPNLYHSSIADKNTSTFWYFYNKKPRMAILVFDLYVVLQKVRDKVTRKLKRIRK